MSATEMQESGISQLTTSQRKVLNDWLDRYTRTVVVLNAATKQCPSAPAVTRQPGYGVAPAPPRATFTPDVIESQIDGDFEGWSGETIFKLMNGQIWQQAEYDYMYEYAFMPEVTIYKTSACYKMKVEGVEDTICVRRLK